MDQSSKIPITALTGFLGAGKTTLLNYLLEHNHGLKIGVVVNDYGTINIDAKLVAGQTDTMLELTNGCICCSMDGMELDEAISQFAYPGSPIDYIIIEASGLAEPADLASTLRQASGRLTKLDAIVAVLDAANLEHNAESHAMALQQIEYSDFVVINKTDLVATIKVEEITTLVSGINPRTRILTAIKGEVDVRLLLDPDRTASGRINFEPDRASSHEGHQHLHDRYTAISYATGQPLDPVTFQQFVNEGVPLNVYRAKGVVNLGSKGHRRKYVFQLVGKRAELTWSDWGTAKPATELVFIGKGLNEKALKNSLQACIDTAPEEYDPDLQVILPKHEQ